MSFFAALLDRSPEARFTKGAAVHPSTPGVWMTGSGESFAGVAVSESNALQFTAVLCAVRILSESVAQLPLKLYKSRAGGGKDMADGEPLYSLLHDQPNGETTSFVFRETGQAHLCTWGNFYAEIEMGPRGDTVGLWQRRPDRVEVERRKSDGQIIYRFQREGGGEDVLDTSQVLHVPGLGFNGLTGFSPIRMAREAIGLGLSLERYGSSLFGNGTVPGLVIKHPAVLSPEAQERLRLSFERVHKGPERAGKAMILDEAMDVQQIGLPNDDAEFLATRTFQLQEIARIYNLPPHLLKDLSKSSFNNIEEQGLDFVRVSLLPWLRRWESELNRKVLTQRQREAGFFFEFSVDGFLRGNFETRMKGYQTAVNAGWMTPNQVRSIENMNPDPNLDFYLIPQNMAMLMPDGTIKAFGQAADAGGEPDEEPPARSLPAPAESREVRARRSMDARLKLQDIFRSLIEQGAQRAVTAEVRAIRAEVKRLAPGEERDFIVWLDAFYAKHREFLRSVMGPVLLAYMRAVAHEVMVETEADGEAFDARLDQFHADYEATMADGIAGGGQRQLEALVRDNPGTEGAVAAVEERLSEWSETRAGKIALREATQAGGAVAVAAYAFSGVPSLKWRFNGGDCEICPQMDGRTVQTGQPFARPGDAVGNLQVKNVHSHPPLHEGCRCGVGPA